MDFGPEAQFNEDEITLAWYDYLFKNVTNDFASPKPVRIFIMGANQWRDEDDWPLARAQNTRYFLHSGGRSEFSTAAMGAWPQRPPTPKIPTSTSTILQTLHLRLAVPYAVTRNTLRPGLATSVHWRRARTF